MANFRHYTWFADWIALQPSKSWQNRKDLLDRIEGEIYHLQTWGHPGGQIVLGTPPAVLTFVSRLANWPSELRSLRAMASVPPSLLCYGFKKMLFILVVRKGGKIEQSWIRLNILHKECLLGSPAGQDGGYDGASLAPLHCQIEPGRNMRWQCVN
jgi:hypothetical protein